MKVSMQSTPTSATFKLGEYVSMHSGKLLRDRVDQFLLRLMSVKVVYVDNKYNYTIVVTL